MTKKMRVRVARIAAGAVIAAGASLTAAGAAQALEFSSGDEPTATTPGDGATDPDDEGTSIPDNPSESATVTPPATDEPSKPPATDEPSKPPVTDEPSKPPATGKPSQPPVTGTPTDEPSSPDTTAPSGAPSQSAGGSTGGGNNPGGFGDTGDEAGTGTGAGTDNAGSQPVEQGKAKDELAETGSGDTMFLVIGAATMLAGGIGFRFLPRLTGNRTAA